MEEALKVEEEKKEELENLKTQLADQQQSIRHLKTALSDFERMLRSSMSKKS